MPNDITFRDYQLDAIAKLYEQFGITPAGPPSDQIVAHCRRNRNWEDSRDGRVGSLVAGRSGDDDQSSLRAESAIDPKF